MLCTVNGANVIDNSAAGFCPKGYFNAPDSAFRPQPILPVPRDKWPTWAAKVAEYAAPGDLGVGSTISRELGTAGRLVKATLKALGVPCGCDRREAEFNLRYPYP